MDLGPVAAATWAAPGRAIGHLPTVGRAVGREPTVAHVDYVTDAPGEAIDAVRFLLSVLADPVNAALVALATLAGVVALVAYLRVRPRLHDIDVLAETLAGYDDLVPWMLRLSVGLPLVGAGFQGYLFAPTASFDPAANPLLRVALIGVGFLLLFGLATRAVAAAGLVGFLWALATVPAVRLAIEYLPGFAALVVLGSGRPSADDILRQVAGAEGTLYGQVDPVHRLEAWLDDTARPARPYVPTVLRVGVGVTFVFLGLTQKLATPARALAVVEKYDLTAVVPVDPGLWVVGAGALEVVVGLALIAGLFTRAGAAVAFGLFTLTLFGLPDDPVLAHVTLFGMATAIFTMGAGRWSVDEWLAGERVERATVVPGGD